MSAKQKLCSLYPGRVQDVRSVADIPKQKQYSVYILTFNDKAVVLGHGQYHRAKVILDGENSTTGHIKALYVRLYQLFGQGTFERFIIACENKTESMEIEKILHREIGGNTRNLSPEIHALLYKDLPKDSPAYMIVQMALCSNYDGLSDLKSWRRKDILSEEVWNIIADRLHLTGYKPKKLKNNRKNQAAL